MPKPARLVALGLLVLVLFAALGVAHLRQRAAVEQARRAEAVAREEMDRLETDLVKIRAELARQQEAVETARLRVAALEKDNARLTQEKETIAQSQAGLETELRRALESRDITISELQGKLTVDILDRVLFDSGEATLKPEGREVLQRVADVLAQFPARQIHVIGHTDNVPIRPAARARYPSNWELSTARATAAVRFLTEQAGVDPRRVGAVGYGEFRPVADNATADGRAKNRRIALVVLSEELVGADTAPTVRELTPREGGTNAPPAVAPAPLPAPEAAPPSGPE